MDSTTERRIQALLKAFTEPVYALVTGTNAITSSTSLVDITGLVIPVLPNSIYEVDSQITIQSSTIDGVKVGIGLTNSSGATIEAQWWSGNDTAGTYMNAPDRITVFNTPSRTILGAGDIGLSIIKGTFTTGSTNGNVSLKHLKVTSGTSTVFVGSFLKVMRIS